MSLILEALKKSEQQRRLGEAPTLGSPMIVSRRRRSLLPLLAALVVIAIGVGWWLLRTPAPAPATVAQATAPATPVAPAATATPARAPVTPAKPAATTPRKPALPLPAADRPGALVPLPPASPLVAGPRNPPVQAAGPRNPPVQATGPRNTPAPTVAAKPATVAPPARAPVAPPVAAPPKAATGTKPAAAAPPARRPVVRKPAAAALPSVWELPYSIRKDLPELVLTMHLYADAPRERFVVIDGERYVEGEEIAEGVTLREIRADGMVLDFKGQRFVYPRDGR